MKCTHENNERTGGQPWCPRCGMLGTRAPELQARLEAGIDLQLRDIARMQQQTAAALAAEHYFQAMSKALCDMFSANLAVTICVQHSPDRSTGHVLSAVIHRPPLTQELRSEAARAVRELANLIESLELPDEMQPREQERCSFVFPDSRQCGRRAGHPGKCEPYDG